MNTTPASERNRNRLLLVLLAALFLLPMLVAGILRFTDHHPAIDRQKGELLEPKPDLRDMSPRLAAGGDYAWNPQTRTWRILVPAPARCDATCAQLAEAVEKVRASVGRDMVRVDILWLGAHPAGLPNAGVHVLADDAALRARLPRADDPRGTPVYVLDPNGFVVLRYAPGFEPLDLRTDLSRLLKLG